MNVAQILECVENIRDLIEMHSTESCFLVATEGVALNPLDDIVQLISIETDNICRELQVNEQQLDIFSGDTP